MLSLNNSWATTASLYTQAIPENLSIQYLTFQDLDYEQTCIQFPAEEDSDY